MTLLARLVTYRVGGAFQADGYLLIEKPFQVYQSIQMGCEGKHIKQAAEIRGKIYVTMSCETANLDYSGLFKRFINFNIWLGSS